MRYTISVLLIVIVLSSCERDNVAAGQKKVAIYQLASFQTVTNRCEVDTTTARLSENLLVSNDEIITYKKATAQFTLQAAAINRIRVLADRTPFALTIDKKVIYYGFFKPGYSSSSCDHSITMDVYITYNIITMNLGYPGLPTGSQLADERNNGLLIATLSKQGKLR